jgi:protein TonB
VTSLSILFGSAISIVLVSLLSFNTQESTATTGPVTGVVTLSDPFKPDFEIPEASKAPAGMEKVMSNLKPIVTDDTVGLTAYIPTADENNVIADDPVIDELPINGNGTGEQIIPAEPEIRISVTEMPEFPGGIPAMLKFIGENLDYPDVAVENRISGKVILKFAVWTDGSISRIEILKGADSSLNDEAMRIVKLLPQFKPGKQNGVPVPVWFTLPIVFQLKDN